MKTKIFKYLVFLILTGGFYSCEEELDIDPEKDILGKWEFVETQPYKGPSESNKPAGYTEYLPDGLMRWYDYAVKEYTLEGKYWFTNSEELNSFVLHLEYKKTWIEEEDGKGYYTYDRFPDLFGLNFRCTFISKYKISLYCSDFRTISPSNEYIYKLKK